MARKSIFVGSSRESKDVAAVIAQRLAAAGYRPVRWWTAFPGGSITIRRLTRIAMREVDGAVFLYCADDQLWYRNSEYPVPRDNVVLECGIFIAALGVKRTLVIREANVKLPSDFSGVAHLPLLDDVETVAEEAVLHFDRHFSHKIKRPREEVAVLVDPDLASKKTAKALPDDWFQRALWASYVSARAWSTIVGQSSFMPRNHKAQLEGALVDAVRSNVDVRTVISLGPGTATADREIVLALHEKEPTLRFVPVDMCEGLLVAAARQLADYTNVPAGVLADFEERMPFVRRVLDEQAVGPKLIALLGNTIGHLDRFERSFLNEVRPIMSGDDRLLMDVALAGEEWSPEDDYRAHHRGYSDASREFIASAVARRTGESVAAIVSSFESRIEFAIAESGNDGKPDGSDVQGTKVITAIDARAGRPVYTLRRYHWGDLRTWLTRDMGFEIVHEQVVVSDPRGFGSGVILLRRAG